MNNKQLIQDLEEIIHNGLEAVPLPVQKGNSIRIKQYVIRESKTSGYLVYCTKENKQIARTFCKASAIAIAKSLATGHNKLDEMLKLDSTIQKHVNDARFYKNVIKKSNDDFVISSRSIRYDIAIAESQGAKDKLDKFIFGL